MFSRASENTELLRKEKTEGESGRRRSLYLGFTSTGVDNTAHVAGLVIGMILAAILYRKPKRTCRADIWEL